MTVLTLFTRLLLYLALIGTNDMNDKMEIATFGGGCFWCIEAVIQRLKGVEKITSGYTGGQAPGVPTYREVCSGLTGHAEVIEVEFDAGEF